jgi:hypothetical protein
VDSDSAEVADANPVMAGIVGDPVEYRWSGHLELLGKVKKPIIDVAKSLGEARYVNQYHVEPVERIISEPLA